MKTAIVTGSSYGLGKSITNKLLAQDFKVYGISRSDPKIKDVNFVWIKIDLLNESDLSGILDSIKENKVDLLVNNAGTALKKLSLEFGEKDFEKIFDLNFKTPIKLTALLKDKLEGGLVINISSDSDRFAGVGYGLYCASKAALNIYFDTVALENNTIKVFNLLPSYINTPLQHNLNDQDKDEEFDWGDAMDPDKVAESLSIVVNDRNKYPTSARFIIVSDKLIGDIEDPEKLWYYNIDTSEFKKIK